MQQIATTIDSAGWLLSDPLTHQIVAAALIVVLVLISARWLDRFRNS